MAALQPISEADQCQSFATDSEPASRGDSPTKESAWKRAEVFLASCRDLRPVVTNDDIVGIWEKIANGSYSGVVDTETICEILTKVELEDYSGFDATETCDAARNDGAKALELPGVLEEQEDLSGKLNDVERKAEKLIDRSDSHNFWQKLCKFHKRGNFKKSRRKKGNLRKLFSEADEPDEEPRQDPRILTDTVPPCSPEAIRDAADAEDRFPNDDRTKRAITDVPDVVVIGSGSIVPKDLCSMRTLTSRTQTAPSRATYTTAYI